MSTDWATKMRVSNQQFFDLVLPAIGDRLGGGTFTSVETNARADLATLLDLDAGIDVMQRLPDGGVRGIAARVQNDRDWQTFTVRLERPSGNSTEYDKRRAAINDERAILYPDLTVQAYVIGGRLTSAGWASTADIIWMCEQGHRSTRTNRADGTTFYAISWKDMRKHCRRVFTHTASLEVVGS